MKYRNYLLLLVFAFALSCGSDKKGEEKEKMNFKSDKETKTTADDGVANIVITADDYMKFNKTEIKAKAGQKVKLTLRHIGQMDINVMGHNVVILKEGTKIPAFSAKAASSRDNDFIPKGTTDVIAHTKMIGGKQTDVIEFTAPKAGTYDFICSFPGHSGAMRGKFIVE